MKVSPARKCCPETHREKLFFHLFFGYLQGEGDSKHTLVLLAGVFQGKFFKFLLLEMMHVKQLVMDREACMLQFMGLQRVGHD